MVSKIGFLLALNLLLLPAFQAGAETAAPVPGSFAEVSGNPRVETSYTIGPTNLLNIAVMGVMFAVFLAAGTWFFVRGERNR